MFLSLFQVLMDDEMLLETNQQKFLTQLSTYEIERRFGKQDSPDFQVLKHKSCGVSIFKCYLDPIKMKYYEFLEIRQMEGVLPA